MGSEIADQDYQNKKIVPAATVVIVRDGLDGMEMFMVVRHYQIDFASGALVFPGGKVSTEDTDEKIFQYINSSSVDREHLGFLIAAIRETFEESGILLALDSKTGKKPIYDRLKKLWDYRKKLVSNEISMVEFLENENLIADTESLVEFAHWITPDFMPKRFDTRFYLVKAPTNQVGIHDGEESVDSVWINPKRAMEEYDRGLRTIVFPTRMNIMKLSKFRHVGDALAKSRASKVKTILPWIEERANEKMLCIPKDAGYDIAEENLEKIIAKGG